MANEFLHSSWDILPSKLTGVVTATYHLCAQRSDVVAMAAQRRLGKAPVQLVKQARHEQLNDLLANGSACQFDLP